MKNSSEALETNPSPAQEAEGGIREGITLERIEERLEALEAAQEKGLEQIESEATGVLGQNEVDAIAKGLRIRERLAEVVNLARRLKDSFKEKWLDREVSRALKEATSRRGDYVFFTNATLQRLITRLSPGELARYPEVRTAAKGYLVSYLGSLAGERVSMSDQVTALGDLDSAFQAHPEVVQSLLQDPEVEALREKVFLNRLLDSYSQHRARKIGENLRLDPDRLRSIVKEAIASKVERDGRYGNKQLYDIGQAISDFGIDRDFLVEMGEAYLLKNIALGEWCRFDDVCPRFFPDREAVDHFIDLHREQISEEVLKGALLRIQSKDTSITTVESFLDHYATQFHVTLTVDNFRDKFGGESMEEVVIREAERGSVDPTSLSLLQKLTMRPISEILAEDKGREALYEGAIFLIGLGQPEHFKELVEANRLDMAVIREDPRLLEKVRSMIRLDLERSNFVWRSELLASLGIREEDVKDLAVQEIQQSLKEGSYWRGFKLLDVTPIDENDRKAISQAVLGVEGKFDYLKRVQQAIEGRNSPKDACTILLREHERFSDLSQQRLEVYIDLSIKVASSPSQEIIRIKDQLIDQILRAEDPEKVYEAVDNIFLQNNLPLIGKIERIFDALYSNERLSVLLEGSSPILKKASARRRRSIIHEDLLRIHLESGNQSLKKFLSVLQEGEPLIRKMEEEQALSDEESARLSYLFRKFKAVNDVASRTGTPTELRESLQESYRSLRDELGVRQGQRISDRVVEMFARPIGVSTIDEALTKMREAKTNAHERGLVLVKEGLRFNPGDLVKGVSFDHVPSILQGGSVAREYLGAASKEDGTPLDSDVEVMTVEPNASFEKGFNNIAIPSQYGEVMIVLRNRGQFLDTTANPAAKYDPEKYELFRTGVMGERHYGIRSGFPSSEIDCLIVHKEVEPRQFENLCYTIAQNGHYIPVFDAQGALQFSPQAFEEYRKVFAGISQFEGGKLEFHSSREVGHAEDLAALAEAKRNDEERLLKLKTEVRSVVVQVLQESDIVLKAGYSDSALGAELVDIGSTGRGTNAPGEGDFDFTLRLDTKDFYRAPEIAQKIRSRLQIAEDGPTEKRPIMPSEGNNYQLRLFDVGLSAGNIDLDIGFVSKSEVELYGSHEAVKDKLDSIKQSYGPDAYEEAVANILLAKQWLKAGGVYKKGNFGEGGLGGIGVENLILAHGCNIEEAFGAFRRAAHKVDGTIKSFNDFKHDFKLLDAGVNLRFNHHDNFVLNMNEDGYQRMLDVIEAHFP